MYYHIFDETLVVFSGCDMYNVRCNNNSVSGSLQKKRQLSKKKSQTPLLFPKTYLFVILRILNIRSDSLF